MNLRSGRGSTNAEADRGLGEDQGKNGHGDDHGNANGESHEAPLLGPPPPLPPPPPLMTYAEMMAKILVARRESAPCPGDASTSYWCLRPGRPWW